MTILYARCTRAVQDGGAEGDDESDAKHLALADRFMTSTHLYAHCPGGCKK